MRAPTGRGRPIDWSVEDSIYVAPDAHRRGIGRALLARLIEDADARGFRQMIAVIGDSQQVPSIELHRALGFSLIGTLVAVGFKHGRWLDTVLMQRALGPGDIDRPLTRSVHHHAERGDRAPAARDRVRGRAS